jgi:hypothetical protein
MPLLALLATLVAPCLLADRPTTPPRSFLQATARPLDVPAWTAPALDVDALLAEDEANEMLGVPFRAGLATPVLLSSAKEGRWDVLPDGSRIWRLRFDAGKAPWLSLVLSHFDLPEGAELHFYDEARQLVAGPFTSEDNREDGILPTPLVPGGAAVVELYVPWKAAFVPMVEIDTVVIGYRDITPLAAGSCEIDVNCPQGAAWQADKRAVARILFNGYLCTGSLLNDVPQDCKNYFLTANHCISSAADASACIFYWNYERPTCGAGSGSLSQYQTGSVIRATSSASDFTLLELNATPAAGFNTYRAGWSRTGVAPSSAIGIHHPSGDVKKISFENNPLVNGVYKGTNFWRVQSWDLGATEGGSSGSPLFDPAHGVVGQLWGGTSQCPDPTTWDEYGKFSASWSVGAGAATRLRDWLDPANAAPLTLAGKESSSCGGAPPPSCSACPSQDFGPLTPSPVAQTHASSIVSGGCRLYAFNVTMGCQYRFTFCAGGGAVAWDSVLDLLSNGCAALSTNDDSCGTASQLDWLATYTGVAYLKVRGFDAAAYGSYTLAYSTLSCPSACVACPGYDFIATPTSSYRTHASSIVSGGCRVYKVGVIAGARYRFTFCNGGGAASWDTVLDRSSSDCVLQQTVDDSCGTRSTLEFTASAAGTAYIKVRGYDAAAYGSYTIAYRRF